MRWMVYSVIIPLVGMRLKAGRLELRRRRRCGGDQGATAGQFHPCFGAAQLTPKTMVSYIHAKVDRTRGGVDAADDQAAV
jgi:hypothetical protein